MPKLFLIENPDLNSKLTDEIDIVSLHENLFEILFSHKEKIYNQFNDVKGTFLIDHFAVYVIDQDRKITVFSVTPSVEFNLLSQGLWKHDKSFSISYQRDNRFYRWDEAYDKEYFEKIKHIKEFDHAFTFGFNLSKKIESFQLIYSFATRSKINNWFDYYGQHISELFSIGDYLFKSIYIIKNKMTSTVIPEIKYNITKTPFLKLVKNKYEETK